MKIGLKTRGYKGELVRKLVEQLWDVYPEEEADVIFCIGWNKMITEDLDRHVILHDSILPRYRGWCPTVTALIEGDSHLGVTAFRPTAVMDEGPIIARSSCCVEFPIKIKDAYDKQFMNYAECLKEIVVYNDIAEMPVMQPYTEISYSLWRNKDDYLIDWNWDAQKIERFVNAVGFPYEGARTHIMGINDGYAIDDVNIINRKPGKIFRVNGDEVDVVCGKGLYRITKFSVDILYDVFRSKPKWKWSLRCELS